MKRSNLISGILLLVILVQMYLLIFRKPETTVEPFDDTALRQEIAIKDSIANYWADRAIHWEMLAIDFELKSDSLESVKTNIKTEYREIYRTLPHATNQQLDSILRANW